MTPSYKITLKRKMEKKFTFAETFSSEKHTGPSCINRSISFAHKQAITNQRRQTPNRCLEKGDVWV